MKKSDSITRWKALETGTNPLAVMQPIMPKLKGSRYGCDGIRIDGSPEFIDAVLSNLKGMLDGENNITRLELARNAVKQQPGYKSGQNASMGAECCYIRLHMRTAEGAHVSAVFDRDLHAVSERYAEVLGA